MHKGDQSTFPENSLSAIESAFVNGAQGSEFDVRHTKDGVPILHHDSKFGDLVKDKGNKVCNKKLAIASQFSSDIYAGCVLKNGEEIPKLSDVLKEYSGKKFILFIELKDKPTERSISLIKKYNSGNFIVISHYDEIIDSFKMMYKDSIVIFKISKYLPRPRKDTGNLLWWPFRFLLKWSYFSWLRKNQVGLFPINSKEDLLNAESFSPFDYFITSDIELCSHGL